MQSRRDIILVEVLILVELVVQLVAAVLLNISLVQTPMYSQKLAS